MSPRSPELDWRRAANVLTTVLLVVVVVLVGVVAVPELVGADESYVVTSSSMAPTIGAGSVVFVEDVATTAIETGDVITYRDTAAGALVTHRVVGVQNDGSTLRFRTKGDANEEADPGAVTAEQVVGRVSFHLPLIGHLVAFAGSRLGIVAMVVIPAVLLIAMELRSLVADARGDGE